MKKLTYLCILTISIVCFSCKSKTIDVLITPTASIQLPSDFKKVDHNHPSGIISFEAKKNEAIYLAVVEPVDGLDTMSLDQKKKSLEANMQAFIQGFNGQQISNNSKITNLPLMKEYSFEHTKNDSSFISHSQMMLTEKEMIMLMYTTLKPETSQTIKERRLFFNSLEIK